MLMRIFLPIILKSFVDKVSRDFSNMHNQQAPPRPEGDIKISMDSSKQKDSQEEGEYVDFEEVN
jgi:hypothetical protein